MGDPVPDSHSGFSQCFPQIGACEFGLMAIVFSIIGLSHVGLRFLYLSAWGLGMQAELTCGSLRIELGIQLLYLVCFQI